MLPKLDYNPALFPTLECEKSALNQLKKD